MKINRIHHSWRRSLLLLVTLFSVVTAALAQQITLKGVVKDSKTNESIIGANIIVKGTTEGTISDIDGNFSLTTNSKGTLVIRYVGYKDKEIAIAGKSTFSITLDEDAIGLGEVVAIGYGSVKKNDATGSLSAIKTDPINRMRATTPEDLLVGKVAGVQITSGGGQPGTGQTIRIRGGSSLSASNDPLIVIDGVPVDNTGVSGMANPLATVNPNDIESFTVLKDASATAIYGSRASNGVIIITTKKGALGIGGTKSVKVSYDGNVSVSTPSGRIDVLNASEFRDFITNNTFMDQSKKDKAIALLSNHNTDWQNEVMRTAISTDHNVSIAGAIPSMPYRASVGYSYQDGIIKTSNMQRVTAAVGLSPSFLNKHLSFNLNLKGMYIKNRLAGAGIGDALGYDPTKPIKVTADDPQYGANAQAYQEQFGGYFAWATADEQGVLTPSTLAGGNPVAKLNQTNNQSSTLRSLGNLQIDYKMHFLPELRANLNLGYDVSSSQKHEETTRHAAFNYLGDENGGGNLYNENQLKYNLLLDFYLNYTKEVKSIKSKFDVMAGYSWQHFKNTGRWTSFNEAGSKKNGEDEYGTENYLVSFFGRFNYGYDNRYLLTVTLRGDGSSRFSSSNRWGIFPAAALAWKINEEAFMKDQEVVSDLKLRLGWGITGQQDINQGDYPYMPKYTLAQLGGYYQFGYKPDGTPNYVIPIRPDAYNGNLKWEQTTTYNAGIDYGFLNNRITGSIEGYYRETNDLLNVIPVPAGSNFRNEIISNIGSLINYGVEFSIDARIIQTKNWGWQLGFNATYNKNEITKLTANTDPSYAGVPTGGIQGGTGSSVQIHSIGNPVSSFYVYEQVYDTHGKPIEGMYVDQNNDGVINENDRIHHHKPSPDVFLGISTKLTYKGWDFSFSGRANLGNYVYNNVESNNANLQSTYYEGYLNNRLHSAVNTGFQSLQVLSSYYVRNASFFRMDNINLGYTFGKLAKGKLDLRLYGMVQNPFVITAYTGLDPEVQGGIDQGIYPRPVVYLFGVTINY